MARFGVLQLLTAYIPELAPGFGWNYILLLTRDAAGFDNKMIFVVALDTNTKNFALRVHFTLLRVMELVSGRG